MVKNSEKTQFRSGSEQVKTARKGGIASGKARREKKTVKKLLEEFMNSDVSSNKQLQALARKAGIESDASIKQLYIMVTILNSLKSANFDDLGKLQTILGEQIEETNGKQAIEDDPLTKSLMEEAERMNGNAAQP